MNSTKDKWTEWNPGKPPATDTIIVALIQNYNTNDKQFVLLKAVDEDDVSFRLYETNSEFAELNWQIIKYKVLDEHN